MINVIEYKGEKYPKFQSEGNASQFAIPFARHFCKGVGYDIGFCKEEWKLEYAIGIDLNNADGYHAMNLPEGSVDFIYSSHCLEHLDSWVKALEYWVSKLKSGGVLFLYLPHEDQKYWLPWNNKKHNHVLNYLDIKNCLESLGIKNIFYSERDLNHSFIVVGEKI